jgi:hypothetical protein
MRLRHVVASVIVALALGAATAWAASQWTLIEPVTPNVVAGENLGFRVEGLRGGSTPVGTVVVRVNGQWVEAEVKLPGRGTTQLSSR